MIQNEEILKLVEEQEEYIIACRRKVHTIAEVATTEFKTKAFIIEEIEKLGLPYEEVPDTSVIAKLDTGRPGPVLALRADIDALPVVESPTNLVNPRVCMSETGKTCHACGHDGHTSMLLGAMQVLCQLKDRLNGTILFCFEEGEEIGAGVEELLKALDKYNVDQCWGMHVYAGLEENKISVDAGPRMAGAVGTYVNFHGKGGHGSRPDQAANPLFAGAAFLMNLEAAMGQQVKAGQTVTQGITMFHIGDAANVIADTAKLGGTFRFFDVEEGQKAVDRFKQVAEMTAPIYGCTAEFPVDMVPGYPVLNNADSSAKAEKALKDIFPEGTVVNCEPWYASESFARWLNKYPGVFAFLGLKNEEEGFGALHHNEKFDFNEKILRTGAIATVRYAVEWLGQD